MSAIGFDPIALIFLTKHKIVDRMRKFITLKHAWLYKFSCLIGLSSLLTASEANAQTYCTATNTSTSSYYIANVTSTGGITNLSNASNAFSTGGYADYTSQYILTPAGASLTINASGGPAGYTYVWAIYCDWNQDGDFADPGETVYTYSSYVGSISATFTVPATANVGNIRMRIRDAYISPVPPSCGANTWGEAEDYTIKVLPPNNVATGSLVSPSSMPFCSNSTQPISVSIINHGSNAITSANINWSLDGVMQAPVLLPTTLTNYNDSVTVTLGNVFFADTTSKTLNVWTSMPNGVPDPITSDDSIAKTIGASLTGVIVHITPQDTTICKGQAITLDAGANHPDNPIYVWNNGQITQTISVSDAGTYSVWVQNSVGCFDYDTITVNVHPEPVVNSIAIIDNGGGSYTINVIGAQNVVNYHWDFGDGNTQDGTNTPGQVIHQYADSGAYTVTLTLINDCGSISVTRLISTTGPVTTGIDNVTGLQRSISIAPNPSKATTIVMASNDIKMKSIVVYNLLGQKVFAQENVNASKYELNVSSLSDGMYNVIIDTDKGQTTKKLEVVR